MQKEWTIIFLIYADFRKEGNNDPATDLDEELSSLFNDLKFCTLHDDMEVLVIQNKIVPDGPKRDFTELLRVIPDASGQSNEIVSIETFDTLFIAQKKDELGKIFNAIHNNKYANTENLITRGKKYLLITWDHGSAFGIFRRDITPLETEHVTKHLMNVKVKSNNSTTLNFNEIHEMIEKPFNLVKTSSGYRKIEREWEAPTYKYFTPKGKFLFQLDSNLQKDEIIRKSIGNSFASRELTVRNNNSVSFKMPEIDFDKVKAAKPSLAFTQEDIHFIQHNNFITADGFEVHAIRAPRKIFDILTNEELQQAIDVGFSDPLQLGSKKKIDVLVMMNCYMMNVHTCYALRDCVDFLVAPQAGISKPGYNYDFILKEIYQSLLSQPIEARILSDYCVSSSLYHDNPARLPFKSDIDKWILIGVELKNYELITNAINEISARLIKIYERKNTDPFKIFNNVRNKCIRFDDLSLSYYMVDITHWLSRVIIELREKGVDDEGLSIAYIQILELIKQNTVATHIGNDCFLRVTPGLMRKQPFGSSLYFPLPLIKNMEYHYFIDRNSDNQSSFLRHNRNWLAFLCRAFSSESSFNCHDFLFLQEGHS